MQFVHRGSLQQPAGGSRELVSKFFVLLCFSAFLTLGLAIYRDYGFSVDEDGQRETGVMTVKYVVEQLAPSLAHPAMNMLARWDQYYEILVPLDNYSDRYYGAAFEAPAVALEGLFSLTDDRDIFLFRHLLTFMVCLGGAFAVYCLALRRFADRRIGLLAVAFLLLSPRIFADSFYNSKDAVFMAAFAIALNTAIAFVLQPRPSSAVLHALATAFAIDVRVPGIVIPIATMAILTVRAVKREVPARRSLSALAIYLAATAVLVVALWPWLWSDPLDRFGQALAAMSRFGFDNDIFYMGALVRTTQLPWHYIPVWVSITTPPLHLVLFVIGTAATGRQFIISARVLWKDEAELQDLVFLGMFVAPVSAVILLHSVLYDGWRQLYFIYPAFLLITLRGWHTLWSSTIAAQVRRPVLVGVTAISFAATAAWMWRTHPLQNVYFNVFAGTNLKANYELDYWGLSTRGAVEYVLAHDPSGSINVREANYMALKASLMLLTPKDRRRLRVTTDENIPHYAFTNNNRPNLGNTKLQEHYDLFYEFKVDGEAILSIFKRKAPSSR
jgi:hypothetical protein